MLTGFVAVNSETGQQAGSEEPRLRQVQAPGVAARRDGVGPGQVQNQFRSDPEAQNVLNLLRQGETDVINGNLLTLPVGGGLLYVQPVYVRSSQGTQFPLLQKVFVSFGDQVGFADTLSGALDQIFGSGVDGPSRRSPPSRPSPPSRRRPGRERGARRPARRRSTTRSRHSRMARRRSRNGDFAAYGEAQDALAEALGRAASAESELDAATGAGRIRARERTPSPRPAPRPRRHRLRRQRAPSVATT